MAKENENKNEQPREEVNVEKENEQPKTARKGIWGKLITGAIAIGLGVGGYFLGRKQGRKQVS